MSNIFECRVYTPDNKLKEVVAQKDCERLFWKDFNIKEGYRPPPKQYRKIRCMFCGDTVQVLSKKAVMCKKKACKTKKNQMDWGKRKKLKKKT